MTDPDQVLADYEGTLAEAQRRSDAIREALATLQVIERSADGQISVTVNDAGNLVDLELGNALQRRGGRRGEPRGAPRRPGGTGPCRRDRAGGHGAVDGRRLRGDAHDDGQAPQRDQPPAEPERPSWGPQESGLGRIEDDQPSASRPPQPPRRPDDDDDFSDGGYLR